MSSFTRLLYAVLAYASFLLASAWAAGFLAGRGAPTSIDGPAGKPAGVALAIDGALLLAFAAQHTVMARASFKRRLPAPVERSTFVLASSLLLAAVFGWWQPVPALIWHVGSPWSVACWAVYALGWAIVVASTFMVDHLDFLGLKQAYRVEGYREPAFKARWLYAYCRHPMMLGLLLTFWATPRMSVGHLFFALASTGYIAVGIRFEERDLRTRYAVEYREYARRVPALIPVPGRTRRPSRQPARAGRG